MLIFAYVESFLTTTRDLPLVDDIDQWEALEGAQRPPDFFPPLAPFMLIFLSMFWSLTAATSAASVSNFTLFLRGRYSFAVALEVAMFAVVEFPLSGQQGWLGGLSFR